eukprot:100580-Amphidinium_carterae.2
MQLSSGIKKIKLPRRSGPVIIGEHRLDSIRIREGCAPATETRIVLWAEDHRHIQAVRKETAISAHVVATKTEECAIMYPERLVLCVKAPTTTTTPVSWRIGNCGQAVGQLSRCGHG